MTNIHCTFCNTEVQLHDNTAYCARCDLHMVGDPQFSRRVAGYFISLPERVSRILVGSFGGLVKGVSEIILPDAIRRTKLYQVLLKKNLRFLIEQVGDVEGVYLASENVPSKFVARKVLGNFVELSGILTLHVSPVWVLALVSDVTGGTRVFLDAMAQELKREGLLDAATQVDTLDQLLDGIQSFSGRMADKIDTPPLSLEELRETARYLRERGPTTQLRTSVAPEALDSMFAEMQELARKENRSLFEISSAVAMGTVNQLQRSGRAAITGLRVGKALVDQSIFDYYRRALAELTTFGYYRFLARSSVPYLRAIRRHLTWNRVTWTERYFVSRALPRIRSIPRSDSKGNADPGSKKPASH